MGLVIDDPIFIIGTERSGSNLLRLVLNTHKGIAVPHPPHVVRYFRRWESGYGDLSEDSAFRKLTTDVVWLVRRHIYPWEAPIDQEAIVRTAPVRDSFGIVCALYEQYREWAGKRRWCCKSTFMIEEAGAAMRTFPKAQFLFLVRDPRDVAVSSRKSVFSAFDPYFTASLWSRQQRLGIELLEQLDARTILLVRYEDLLANSERTVQRICEFLGEPFEPNMLNFFNTREAQRSADLAACWKNTARPIMTENAGKYRKELTAQEIAMIERVAGSEMEHLGYVADPDVAGHPYHQHQKLEHLRAFSKEWYGKLRVEASSLRRDKNALRRWGRDGLVAYLGFRRGFLPRLRRLVA